MIIPSNYAQVNFIFGGAALPLGAEFTMGMDINGYGGSASDLAEDCATAYVDNLINYNSDQVEFLSTHVKFGPNDTGAQGDFSANETGGTSGAPLEPAVAVLVQKVTAHGGRSGRGRFFLPGFLDSISTSGGVIGGTELTALQTDVTAFLNDLSAFGGGPVVLHAPGPHGGDSPWPITNLVVSSQVATQRRRNRK